MKKQEDEFLQEDLDDEKTIEFIKSYLPQDLKDRFTDDQLYYSSTSFMSITRRVGCWMLNPTVRALWTLTWTRSLPLSSRKPRKTVLASSGMMRFSSLCKGNQNMPKPKRNEKKVA